MKSKEIRLRSRPKGLPFDANFELVEREITSPDRGEVLVRNLFMSVDPYMRGRMNDTKSYVPPFEIGEALSGGAIGEVVESRAVDLKPGDTVVSMFGWREYFVAPSKVLRPVSREVTPLSIYLGTLGMTGFTAWVGLRLVDIKPGEVLFISGAAGAVGNVAGQLAKVYGCRVIGSAGSNEKVRFLLEECGFSGAFNYKTAPIQDQLKRITPDGIDVYFDNVGGETLEAALTSLRVHGRVVACGSISVYNKERPEPGPSNLSNIVTNRLTIKGMIVSDWMHQMPEFQEEVGGYVTAGNVRNQETVVKGIEHAVEAFRGLFQGDNVGKMIVDLS